MYQNLSLSLSLSLICSSNLRHNLTYGCHVRPPSRIARHDCKKLHGAHRPHPFPIGEFLLAWCHIIASYAATTMTWFFLCFIPDELLCYFYSLSEDRIYKIHLPDGWEFKSVDLFDLSSTGWFHASKEKTDDSKFTSLLNLFTGTAVYLPVPQINLNIMQICPDCSCIREIGDWLMAKHYFISVTKSSIYPEYDCIISNLTRYAPMVKLNVFTLQILTSVFQLLKKEHLYYLAVISDKLYILVNVGCGPLQFMVYVMNRFAKKQKWIYVSDIGNRAILYDQSCCFLVEAGCSTGLERNCIYFPELRPCKTGVDHHVDWFYCMSISLEQWYQ